MVEGGGLEGRLVGRERGCARQSEMGEQQRFESRPILGKQTATSR